MKGRLPFNGSHNQKSGGSGTMGPTEHKLKKFVELLARSAAAHDFFEEAAEQRNENTET